MTPHLNFFPIYLLIFFLSEDLDIGDMGYYVALSKISKNITQKNATVMGYKGVLGSDKLEVWSVLSPKCKERNRWDKCTIVCNKNNTILKKINLKIFTDIGS